MHGGDVLARGGVKASFPPAGGNISQERWDAIWAEDNDAEKRSGDANVAPTGNAGIGIGEDKSK